MRSLSAPLTAEQKKASHIPYPRVEVYDTVAAIARLHWERLYTGSEVDRFHACAMPGDGSLIRLRTDASNNLYRQRVTSPGPGSSFSSWTSWGVTAYAVAICSYQAKVYAFRIGTDGHLYRCESSDNGASWGSWTDMGDVSATIDSRLAACFKDSDEAIVLYSPPWGDEEVVDSYESGDDTASTIYGVNWNTQTFTPSQPCRIIKVSIKAYRVGSPGFLDVGIRATDANGKPTGTDFTQGSINANTFTTDTGGAWYAVTLPAYELTQGTRYAIVVRATSGNSSNYVMWRLDESSPTYSQGERGGSSNSGSTWTMFPTQDALFKVHAQPKAPLYRRRLSGGSWESAARWSNFLHSITGLAVTYLGDWNVLITGTAAATADPGVWTCLLGDGYSAPADSWTSLKELSIAASDSGVSFKSPALARPDVFRAFFVEAYSGTETYSRPYWTHAVASADFISNLWREPVPFNLASDYGLALCHKSPYAWLTRPDGVWRASCSAASVDLTADVLSLKSELLEASGSITVELRNDDGRYNTLGTGTYAAVKRGSELRFSPGYDIDGTPAFSTGLAFWLTGWDHVSQGGRATLILHAVDGWGLLERWKARRQFTWNEGQKTIFKILDFIHARAGLEFTSLSYSAPVMSHYPPFTISPGETGKTAVLRLLVMVQDVIFFRGNYAYLKNPLSADGSDYTYGTSHPVLEGRYATQPMPVNRAQVYGDGVFTEDWDWDDVELMHDALHQRADLYLDTTARAHSTGQAILRKAAIHELAGSILVPLNCGQELYDVVSITDSRAGLSSAKRRALVLQHTYSASKGVYTLRMALGGP